MVEGATSKVCSVSRCEVLLSGYDILQPELNRFHNWAIFFDKQNFCALQRTRLTVLNCKGTKVIYEILSNKDQPKGCLVRHEYW